MFDIGFVEMLVIAVLGLLVLGPERLPRVARTLGHWVGRARAMFNHVKSELEREGHNAEMQEKFREQLEEMGLTEEDLKQGQQKIFSPDDIPGHPSERKNLQGAPDSAEPGHDTDNRDRGGDHHG